MPGKVGFVSLGCPKALVDSERIISQLKIEGYDTVHSYADADVVVVNTCGFIDSAVEESLDAIKEAMDANGRVVVTGCLGAKADVVREAFPDVLAVTGPHQYEAVVEAVHSAVPRPEHDPFQSLLPNPLPGHGVKLTPRHYAYLKISEGCNHKCSFCVIPQFRGKLQSRRAGDILREAESLAGAGVQELLVISQDTSAYGVDLRYRTDFYGGRPVKSKLTDLCRELGALVPWVRLHYVYPYPHVDELIPLMADGLVLPYLDVPLQHASPTILKAMRRPAAAERSLERITEWRAQVPDIGIRSTFIVGFPGESAHDFELLLDFLRDAELDRVGCFAYSDVDGAAANALPGQISEAAKQDRLDELMTLQAEISAGKLAAKVGTTIEVIIDEVAPDQAGAANSQPQCIARSSADAPEIDGVVLLTGATPGMVGQIVRAKVTGADTYDLSAELV